MDPEDKARLDSLNDRLNKIQAEKAPEKSHQEQKYSQANIGWRMVIELVAGLLIGFGMGYGLDVLLGTLPILLVIFTLLGLAAGIKTMMNTAKEFGTNTEAKMADEGMKNGD